MNDLSLCSASSFERSVSSVLLSKQEMQYYMAYKRKVLKILGWIETDPDRLFAILERFIHTGYVHAQNHRQVLTAAIRIYYVSRSRLSYHISDEEILDQIVSCYRELLGMGIESLGERVARRFQGEGRL